MLLIILQGLKQCLDTKLIRRKIISKVAIFQVLTAYTTRKYRNKKLKVNLKLSTLFDENFHNFPGLQLVVIGVLHGNFTWLHIW